MFSNKMVKLLSIIIIFVLGNILLLQFQSNLIGVLGLNHYNLIVYGTYFIVGLFIFDIGNMHRLHDDIHHGFAQLFCCLCPYFHLVGIGWILGFVFRKKIKTLF